VKFLRILQEIDDKFLEFNLTINYKRQARKLTKTLIGSIALVITLSAFTYFCVKLYKVPMIPFTLFLQVWAFVATAISVHHLIASMVGIEHRFKLLNLFLKAHPTLMNFEVLKNLAEIHFKTCELIKIFNEIYGPIMLSTISITFGWFCIFIFAIATGNFKNFSQYIFLTILDFFVYVLIIGNSFSFIYFAEKLKSQGKLTIKYLYKILHKVDDFRYREVVNSFIAQIRDSQLEVTCKFFHLDWSFLFKVRFF
jgi:hypothetical protein